jgi:hypothetical protein
VTTADQKRETPIDHSSLGKLLPGSGTDLLILAGLWLTSLLAVRPFGNFPLNDDWAFARSVKHLLETGSYYPTAWAAMPLFTHTLWGTLFCLPTGFSFNALRLSTLAMSAAGLAFTYAALRAVHPSRVVAVLGALTLAFNPIYFALSCTFMTDVTFTGMMIGSGLFLYRHIKGGCRLDLLAGSLLALAATLSRQVGMAPPVAFALCLLWTRGCKAGGWAKALVPLLFSAGGLMLYQYWMKTTHRLPFAYDKMNLRVSWVLSDPWLLLIELNKHAGTAALYLGLFALPFCALFLPGLDRRRPKLRVHLPATGAAMLFVLYFTADVVSRRLVMPISGNIIVAQGIGPITLNDAMATEPSYLPSIGKPFWLGVTVLAVLGGALLMALMVGHVCRRWRHYCARRLPIELAGGVFFLLSVAAYLFTILAVGGWDRYYLPALPFLLVGTAALAGNDFSRGQLVESPAPLRRARIIIAVAVLASMALFSICGTHDYLSWNRARWKLLDELMASGTATAGDVDGGFEFNGWFLYDPKYKPQKGKNWWWVHHDDYLVALGDRAGYRRIKAYPYSNWLPPQQRSVLLLGREGTEAGEAGMGLQRSIR